MPHVTRKCNICKKIIEGMLLNHSLLSRLTAHTHMHVLCPKTLFFHILRTPNCKHMQMRYSCRRGVIQITFFLLSTNFTQEVGHVVTNWLAAAQGSRFGVRGAFIAHISHKFSEPLQSKDKTPCFFVLVAQTTSSFPSCVRLSDVNFTVLEAYTQLYFLKGQLIIKLSARFAYSAERNQGEHASVRPINAT